MNVFVRPAYAESIVRLALGIEPIDRARGTRVPHGVDVALEGVPAPVATWRRMDGWETVNDVLPRMQRHPSGHFVLLYRKDLPTEVDIRLFDPERRFVPRRLRVRIPTEAAVMAAETDPLLPPAPPRIFRPALFPGVSYPLTERSTGLRGRVVRGGKPMPWARVVARASGTAEVIARAHGDDRGEFLLVVPPPGDPAQAWTRADPLPLDIAVFGPLQVAAAPAPNDPLSNLPQESATPPVVGSFDGVQAGTALPPGYAETATGVVAVRLPLGVISSAGIAAFPFRSVP